VEERRHIRLEGSFPKGSEQVGQHVRVIDVATETEILDVDSIAIGITLIGPISAVLVIFDPAFVPTDTDETGEKTELVWVDSINLQPKE
jgi:hypothetical protein